MCLDYELKKSEISKLTKEHGEYVGWKIYLEENDNKVCKPQYCGKPQKVGEWLDEKTHRWTKGSKKLKYALQQGTYPIGFHVYLDKDYALKLSGCQGIIRKVYFREILVVGSQLYVEIVVARKIKIIRKKNNVRSKSKKRTC